MVEGETEGSITENPYVEGYVGVDLDGNEIGDTWEGQFHDDGRLTGSMSTTFEYDYEGFPVEIDVDMEFDTTLQ